MHDTRNFTILAMITMTFALTMVMVLPIVPLWASSLGASEFQVGLLVALPPFTSLIFSIPIASCSAYLGLERLMRLAFVVGILSGGLFALATSPAMLIVPQLGFGLALSLYMPQMISYYYHISSTDDRQAMQGYNTTFQGIGALTGPLLAGLVGQYLGLIWIFVLYGALSLIGYLLCRSLRPVKRAQTNQPLKEVVFTSYREALTLLRSKKALRVALFFGFLMVVLWQGLGNTIFPLFIEARYVAVTMLLGVLIALREFGALAARLFFAYLCRFASLYTILSGSIGLMIIANLVIPSVFHPVALGLACLLLGLGLGSMAPGMNLLALDSVTLRQGPLAMATSGLFIRLGLMISAPILGGMAGTIGFPMTFYITALVCLITLIIFVRWKLWPPWAPGPAASTATQSPPTVGLKTTGASKTCSDTHSRDSRRNHRL